MSDFDISVYNIVNAFEAGILLINENLELVFLNKKGYNILQLEDEAQLQKILPELLNSFKLHDFIKSKYGGNWEKINFQGKDIMVHVIKVENDMFRGDIINFNNLDTLKNLIKQVDNEVEASSLLSTIMDATNDCIVYVNHDGIIEMLSQAYADFLQIDRDESIGKHVRDIIENTRMDIVIKTGKIEIAQVQQIHGRKMIATRIPIFVSGKIVGAVGKVLFRDVDELNALYMKINKIEKELNLYKDEFKKANKAKYALDSIIGESQVMKHLKDVTNKVANTNSNVLILGDSGTGKELFANAIHNNSKRMDAPFIKVNCGAIPYELVESELFGYEEGAFTGAKKGGKIGKFKAADGGTIFLDEIADLPMNIQVKLLRVLQDREIERIGSTISEKVDVRVIAATNKNLEQMVEEGMFRLDLYYRLNVVNIKTPSLIERKEDIPLLAKYLIDKIADKESILVGGISSKALEVLKNYDWPGNVRELENILERAINFLGDDTRILIKHLPPKITGMVGLYTLKSLKETMQELEKEVLVNSLLISKGNKTEAAETLKISRTSLYEKLTKYGIDM